MCWRSAWLRWPFLMRRSGGLRTYLFSHTTNRIDVGLGAQLFRHILALPLAYFEARRVGDTVARVRELEQIRQFLTSHSVTVVLDLVFTVVFLVVMWFYSSTLTMVVMGSLPLYALLSIAITPTIRARLHENSIGGRRINRSWSRRSAGFRPSRRWRSSRRCCVNGKSSLQAMYGQVSVQRVSLRWPGKLQAASKKSQLSRCCGWGPIG